MKEAFLLSNMIKAKMPTQTRPINIGMFSSVFNKLAYPGKWRHLSPVWKRTKRIFNRENDVKNHISAHRSLIISVAKKLFSRLNTLCTPLVWMRIAAVATLNTTSGYVVKCSVQNCVHCTSVIYCLVQNFVHCSRYRKCKILSAEYKMTILHYNST